MMFLSKKSLAVYILASLCLIKHGQALQCYSCLAATSSANCQSIETCAATSYCYTIQATVLGVSTYSKGCLAACATTSTGTESTGSKTTCCQTDKCNSGANSLIKKSGILMSIGFMIVSVFIFL